MNKKGIELSVNFLVSFILAFVVFGFGLYFATTISDQAFDQAEVTEDFLAERIDQIACSSNEKVCISNNYAELSRGDTATVGVFINNFEDTPNERRFAMNWLDDVDGSATGSGENKAYNDDGTPMSITGTFKYPPLLIPVGEKTINARSVGNMGFAIFVPKDAESGKYVYTLQIEDVTSSLPGGTVPLGTIREKITFYVQ